MYYFASDVHLGAGDADVAARTEKRFTAWLDSVSRDAKEIWLLGDIFDFWYEYERVVPKGFVRSLGKLAELSDRGIKIVYLTGNHDMWVRDYFAVECGAEVCTGPVFTELAGKKLFVAHGDNMRIEGKPLLRLMNWGFRSRAIRFLFSWLVHPDLANIFGRWWSGKSRKSHGGKFSPSILEPLKAYGAEVGREKGVDCCIFGHFHLADDSVAEGTRIVFLGDWSSRPTYAALTDDGVLTLETFDAQ